MIECKDVDYILAISRHQNISLAAQELFISQPALTKYLKNLEDRLGVVLFDRSKKKLTPTLIGERYIAYAAEIALTKQNMAEELNRIKSEHHGNLRIGFSCTGLRNLLYNAVRQIRMTDPSLKITLQELTSGSIESDLLRHRLDLGFITLPAASSEIYTELMLEEYVLLAVPSDHPLAQAGTVVNNLGYPWIDLSRFRSASFILRNPGTRFRGITDRLFLQCGFEPEITTTARNHFSCMEFAEAWNLPFFTTQTFIKNLKNPDSMRFFIPGSPPVKVPVGMARRRGEALSVPGLQLIRAMNRLIAEGPRKDGEKRGGRRKGE